MVELLALYKHLTPRQQRKIEQVDAAVKLVVFESFVNVQVLLNETTLLGSKCCCIDIDARESTSSGSQFLVP